jgi:hypothetical protein
VYEMQCLHVSPLEAATSIEKNHTPLYLVRFEQQVVQICPEHTHPILLRVKLLIPDLPGVGNVSFEVLWVHSIDYLW